VEKLSTAKRKLYEDLLTFTLTLVQEFITRRARRMLREVYQSNQENYKTPYTGINWEALRRKKYHSCKARENR
jgi:hypothetical protein